MLEADLRDACFNRLLGRRLNRGIRLTASPHGDIDYNRLGYPI
jgi:hypothetical protein